LDVSAGIPLYATLSHCWGVLQFIKTTSSKVSSFRNGIPFDALPRTFQDAILSDNQVIVACATLGKLCQISLLPLTKNTSTTSLEINTINLLNLILMSPKTHIQYTTVISPAAF
jgi:hypothetical protein